MQLFYELSADDMAAAQKLFWRRRRAPLFWGFTIYGTLFFLFALVQLIRGSVGGSVFPLIFGALMMTYFPLLLPRSARSGWAKLRYLQGATTLTTSDEGLQIANSMGHSFLRWEGIDNVLEGPSAWLLFIGPLYFHIVPTRAFTSDEERARFRSELHRIGARSSSGNAPIAAP